MAHMCKEMVSTDGITVGTMCGRFTDDEPWDVGVDADTYHRKLKEALELQDEERKETGAEEV